MRDLYKFEDHKHTLSSDFFTENERAESQEEEELEQGLPGAKDPRGTKSQRGLGAPETNQQGTILAPPPPPKNQPSLQGPPRAAKTPQSPGSLLRAPGTNQQEKATTLAPPPPLKNPPGTKSFQGPPRTPMTPQDPGSLQGPRTSGAHTPRSPRKTPDQRSQQQETSVFQKTLAHFENPKGPQDNGSPILRSPRVTGGATKEGTKAGGEEPVASHQEGDEGKAGGGEANGKGEGGKGEGGEVGGNKGEKSKTEPVNPGRLEEAQPDPKEPSEKPVPHLEEPEVNKANGTNEEDPNTGETPGGPQSNNSRDDSPTSWARETEQLAEQERKKSLLIRNTVTHLHSKLVSSGGVLKADDAAFFTSSMATLDSGRFELIDGVAKPRRGLDPFGDLRVMLRQFMDGNKPRLTHCESLYERLAEDITKNVTNILRGRRGSKVPSTLSQSRRRSDSTGDDQTNKRSRQQLSPEGNKQPAPRNELFEQVALLLGNEHHHQDPSLTQLSREVAQAFIKEGDLKGTPFVLNNSGQFCPVSRQSSNWPWQQLLSILDNLHPNYHQDALKKFMSCTHLAMRDILYNRHQADQMAKGRNLTEEMQAANSLVEIPYEQFDVLQASQSRVVAEEEKRLDQGEAEKTTNETKETEEVMTADEGEERRAGAKEKKAEEKEEEEEKDDEEEKKKKKEEEKEAKKEGESETEEKKKKKKEEEDVEEKKKKKEVEEEVNANEEGESKKKKEKQKEKVNKEERKNTRSTNKGEGFELNTP